MITLIDRLDEKIRTGPGCWEWLAGRYKSGYGAVWIEGKMHLAHRVVYELLVGDIPDELQLDHLCRVRHCVNPSHLEPVTSAENTRRGEAAERRKEQASTVVHCPKGHEYSTRLDKKGKEVKYCKECHRTANRESARKRRARNEQ